MARLSWPGWLVIYWDRFSHTRSWNADMVTHPSTNSAWHRENSLIKTSMLPLCQTATAALYGLLSEVVTVAGSNQEADHTHWWQVGEERSVGDIQAHPDVHGWPAAGAGKVWTDAVQYRGGHRVSWLDERFITWRDLHTAVSTDNSQSTPVSCCIYLNFSCSSTLCLADVLLDMAGTEHLHWCQIVTFKSVQCQPCLTYKRGMLINQSINQSVLH